ncbi:hypothetical protein ABVK25_008781 [Lepraria finkii]|uniref:Myb-like DNA-binding domain-containing protein n=1 Tax=Lepraria finkii TaxID=1340010 RepID=A0ABR4B0E6_9LECA
MASLRRNRTMPTDGAIAKFLYTILKQLDLKFIDWQEVANGLDITNGHAARMRFSRFKQQMEGTASQPRKPRPTAPRPKKTKPDKPPSSETANTNANGQQESGIKGESMVKGEPGVKAENIIKGEPIVKAEPRLEDEIMQDVELEAKPEPIIKEETKEDEVSWANAGDAIIGATQDTSPKPPSHNQQTFEAPFPADKAAPQLSPELSVSKEDAEDIKEPIVKPEPALED